MIAPIAQFGVIPYMKSAEGQSMFGWLIGTGETRGIALIFFFSGLIMIVAAFAAFMTKSYKKISKAYAKA